MTKFSILAAGLAVVLSLGAANAKTVVFDPDAPQPLPANLVTEVDIAAGQFITTVEILGPGDSAEFRYTALEPLKIGGFALAGTGNNGGDDISNVTFGFEDVTTETWTTVTLEPGNTAAASGGLPGLSLDTGDSFSIFWDDGVQAPVGVTASFTTVIPVPAALPLLLGALGALGIARRKA